MAASQIFIVAYLLTFCCFCLVVLAGFGVRPRRVITKVRSEGTLSLGIVVPAYNEFAHTASISAAIGVARHLGVPIVVVDDGSTDGSDVLLERLCREGGARFERHVVNQGKAAALNTGIAALQIDLVLTIDADTRLNPGNVAEVLDRFADTKIGAVALTIEGGGASFCAGAQIAEYRYILNFERVALARLGIVFTVPGAASVWRSAAVADIGGFRSRTCAEDTDATVSLSLAGWRIDVVPSVAKTDCPASLRPLLKQRARWIWGTIQAAGFALAHLGTRRSLRDAGPATAFVLVTVLNISGFLLSVVVLWRLLLGEAGWSDIVTGGLLFNLTMIRLGMAYSAERQSGRHFLVDLMRIGVMQAVNTLAFWHGLLTGRAARISW